jgi:hypothetical protein
VQAFSSTAFIDGERWSANVAAEMYLECGVLEVEDFLSLPESHPRISPRPAPS